MGRKHSLPSSLVSLDRILVLFVEHQLFGMPSCNLWWQVERDDPSDYSSLVLIVSSSSIAVIMRIIVVVVVTGASPVFITYHSPPQVFLFFVFTFYDCIVPMGFIPWEIRVDFPGESRLRQSRAAQPTVHAVCFSVSIIHRTLIWTTGSLTCAQM